MRLSLCETNRASWSEVEFPCLEQLQEDAGGVPRRSGWRADIFDF